MIVECRNLSKIYSGGVWSLKACNFQVVTGARSAIIGANGAGKTTLLNLLLGTISPTTGSVFWFGRSIQQTLPELYNRVAFVPEQHSFYPQWTGERVIEFVRSFHAGWDLEKETSLRRLLDIPLKQRIRTYSKGNLVRLSLLLALSQGAQVLIMDEPFAGLDPLIREEILSMISGDLKESARTLILTSHDLFAVEVLAEDLWVLHNGEFLYSGSLENFLACYKSYKLEARDQNTISGLRSHFFVRESPPCSDKVELQVVTRLDFDVGTLVESNRGLQLIAEKPVTLQDAYAACVHFYVSEKVAK